MRRVAVRIAYYGQDFEGGSQRQPEIRTVLGEVVSNLVLTGGGNDEEWFDLKAAGRTDKGVNALGNVIAFNTAFDDDITLLTALNAVSKGVYYRAIAEVDGTFNPRHAKERIYRYILPSDGIDVGLASRCASLFEGEHDFVRFCRPDGKDTVVNLRSVELERKDEIIVIDFRADHFLWNMIRRIVAAISAVGKGDADISAVKAAIDGKEISFGVARADALTLMDVIYDDIRFFEPADDLFDRRVRNELFRDSLRRSFFASL